MFEGRKATITVAENGFMLEVDGRIHMHPDPIAAVAKMCDALGRHDIAIATEEWHRKNREAFACCNEEKQEAVVRADKAEIDMLRMKVDRLSEQGKELLQENANTTKMFAALKDENQRLVGIITTTGAANNPRKKKPSPRKR